MQDRFAQELAMHRVVKRLEHFASFNHPVAQGAATQLDAASGKHL